MKNIYLLIVFGILFFYSTLNAQWVQTGFNASATITSIVAKGGNLFASTWGGYIFRSTDGGGSWESDTVGLGYWFYTGFVYSLAVVPSSDNSGATNLFAGMEEGGIWRSKDDGETWTWVYPLGKLGNHDMSFVTLGSAGSTILAGIETQPGDNGVYRSVNDGDTWTRCNAGFETAADSSVDCFASIKDGSTTYFYAGTGGGLFISTSDGTAWTRINGLPAGTISAVVALPGPSGSVGINLFAGVGMSGIFHSTDNGSTWTAVNNGIPTNGQTPYIKDLVSTPVPGGTTSNIYAADGNVYFSSDYGANWWHTDWPLSTAGAAQCLCINGGTLFGGGYGIWKYPVEPDTGWVVQLSGTYDTLWTVKAVDNKVAWAGGTNGGVFRTTNGGEAWDSVGGGTLGSDVVYVIEALDANTAFASTSVFSISGSSSTKIFKTTNGGSSWSQVFSQPGGFIGGIQMKSALQGYAMGSPVGGKWTIVKTTDGGNTWNRLTTEPVQLGGETALLSFQLLGNTLWFGSSSGIVYRSTDLGATWNSEPTSGSYVSSLHFNSSTVGLIGFEGGVTNKSTNSGVSWDSASSTGKDVVSCISGLGNEFWATTNTGIAYTNNVGLKWTFTSPGHWGLIHLNAVSISPDASQVNGWAVGVSGLILHYKRLVVSVQQVSSNQPAGYSLEQNYPNPFNPSTSINYSVKDEGLIKIEIYDILGRKVETLLNVVKRPGNYSLMFNAKALTSGVYLYKLEGGTFTAIKKMIVLK